MTDRTTWTAKIANNTYLGADRTTWNSNGPFSHSDGSGGHECGHNHRSYDAAEHCGLEWQRRARAREILTPRIAAMREAVEGPLS